jgi:hypothetical protein
MIRIRASLDSALAISTSCWSAIDLHAEPGEEPRGVGVHRPPVDLVQPGQRLVAHRDVLGHRQIGEQRRLLVDHRDAGRLGVGRSVELDVRAAHPQRAGVRAVHAGQHLDDRRLAGAVLTDQRMRLAGVEREADALHRRHCAEGLGHVVHLEQSRGIGSRTGSGGRPGIRIRPGCCRLGLGSRPDFGSLRQEGHLRRSWLNIVVG